MNPVQIANHFSLYFLLKAYPNRYNIILTRLAANFQGVPGDSFAAVISHGPVISP